MKRRFSQSNGDSLELLLDTLCNVFGGIVLIACLLAIIPRSSQPPPLLPMEIAKSEMIERRIVSAKSHLTELNEKIGKINELSDPQKANLLAKRESLTRTLELLQLENKKIQEDETIEAAARATISQADPDDLNHKLNQLKSEVSSKENIVAASNQKIEFLKERKNKLEEESSSLGKGKIQTVRFPRERAKTSSPFPIIVKFGELFPVAVGESLSANDAILKSDTPDGEGFLAEPIKGQGMKFPESQNTLIATLKAVAAEKLYVTIYLYPDSFQLFQELKNTIIEANLSYGLEFMENGSPIGFSDNGSAPPEL